jgi:hypothetical protein
VRHLYFRERGSFQLRSLFLEGPTPGLTVTALHGAILRALGPAFRPKWAGVRPNYRRRAVGGGWEEEVSRSTKVRVCCCMRNQVKKLPMQRPLPHASRRHLRLHPRFRSPMIPLGHSQHHISSTM